jgi:SSS family solute:Na+ symporter
MVWGTQMVIALHLKGTVYPLHMFGQTIGVYAAVPALLLNLLVSVAGTLIQGALKSGEGSDATLNEDYA